MKLLEVNLRELIKEIRNSKEEFVPKWSNLIGFQKSLFQSSPKLGICPFP